MLAAHRPLLIGFFGLLSLFACEGVEEEPVDAAGGRDGKAGGGPGAVGNEGGAPSCGAGAQAGDPSGDGNESGESGQAGATTGGAPGGDGPNEGGAGGDSNAGASGDDDLGPLPPTSPFGATEPTLYGIEPLLTDPVGAIASDAAGNVYLLSEGGDGTHGVLKLDSGLAPVWHVPLVVDGASVTLLDLAVTSAGAVYVSGASPLPIPGEEEAGVGGLIGRFSASGDSEFLHVIQGASFASFVDVLPDGSAVVGGSGYTIGTDEQDDYQPYVARYSSEGERLSVLQGPMPANPSDFVGAVVNVAGEVYSPMTYIDNDYTVARFDTEGELVWETSAQPFLPAISVAPDGVGVVQFVQSNFFECTVLGWEGDGGLRFEQAGETAEVTLTSGDGGVWRRLFSSCNAVTTSKDSIYVTGTFQNVVEFPSDTEVSNSIFVARLDRNGNQKWFRQLWVEQPPNSTDEFQPVGITALPDGGVIVAANTVAGSDYPYGILLRLDRDGSSQ